MVEIAVLGSSTPGLSCAMAGSFHLVIVPLKMSAMVSPDEVQGVDTLEVVDDGHRADVRRHLDGVGAAGLLRLGDLIGGQERVRAGEGVGLADEVRDAGAGADLLVVDRGAAVCLLVVGAPGLLGDGLGGGAATIEGAATTAAALLLLLSPQAVRVRPTVRAATAGRVIRRTEEVFTSVGS